MRYESDKAGMGNRRGGVEASGARDSGFLLISSSFVPTAAVVRATILPLPLTAGRKRAKNAAKRIHIAGGRS